MSRHWFIAHLVSKCTKGKHIGLDVGSGLDNWKEFKKCKFINIDQKLPADQILDLNTSPLPFANNSFDVVISINVLNYLHNYRILTEIYRVLVGGGLFLCIVNNENANQKETMTLSKLQELTTRFKPKMGLMDRLYAWHYNRTSVYAFIVLEKI